MQVVFKNEDGFNIDPYELELIEGCLKNDRKLQKALYERYCKAMFTISFRILNNYDDANDSLQEAFIQIFKNIETFKKQSTLGSWIKSIVIRTALKKQRGQKYMDTIDEDRDDSPIEWDDNLTGKQLEKAIQALPTGCRSVFILAEVEGYAHKEIAEMLGISEGTSKSQLFHSKKLLQKTLKDLVN